ncbi:PrsW family glutamic-type intramembrane protease [Streptomyces sp. NPDC058195]|uniref:PrsW family intramembrane metalloprotease n=1 Tax=Streptomyces sp. NPDC058195 TaxID=3346375 RepID=UPI0036E03182
MSDGSAAQRQSQPAVPLLEEQRVGEILAAVPERGNWRYRPRRVGLVWRSRAFRIGAVSTVLALCGLAILALVRDQTGTQGFLVGLGLAVLPVPLLMAAFRWLDRVEPSPWRSLLFAFAWGAFAAALIAILANSFATRWIATTTAGPSNADTLGATVIAPFVEESAKAAAVLLIFLLRRRQFTGIVDGIVIAGLTASGFAFTENILYLGNAFGEDQQVGHSGVPAMTAATFFVRAVLSPFAHPLFTSLTGIGFGLAAASLRHQKLRRVLLPLLGLVLAMGMHALWNGSAVFSPLGFYAVYGVFMAPVFGLVTWLAIWSRYRRLRTLCAELPAYAAAGWLAPAEPLALASMRARGTARDIARHQYAAAGDKAAKARGKAAARTVAEYESFATALASLRLRARRGEAGPDFAERELELLHHLWQRREVAAWALTYAAQATGRLRPHRLPPIPYAQPPHPRYAQPGPYGQRPGPYAQPAAYPHHPSYAAYPPYGAQHGTPYGAHPPYGPQPQQPAAYPPYGPQTYGPRA